MTNTPLRKLRFGQLAFVPIPISDQWTDFSTYMYQSMTGKLNTSCFLKKLFVFFAFELLATHNRTRVLEDDSGVFLISIILNILHM